VTTTNVCPRCSARDAKPGLSRRTKLLFRLAYEPHLLTDEEHAEATGYVNEREGRDPFDRILDDVQAAPTLEGRIAGTAAVAHEDDAGDEWATRERPDRFEVL
jgi:hypothetical protein